MPPNPVWMMIDTRARAPKVDTPTLRIVRAHGEAREHGVERRTIEGVSVRITTPAKTVADCFRYQRHVRAWMSRSRPFATTSPSRASADDVSTSRSTRSSLRREPTA
jgi:hypothetical protein